MDDKERPPKRGYRLINLFRTKTKKKSTAEPSKLPQADQVPLQGTSSIQPFEFSSQASTSNISSTNQVPLQGTSSIQPFEFLSQASTSNISSTNVPFQRITPILPFELSSQASTSDISSTNVPLQRITPILPFELSSQASTSNISSKDVQVTNFFWSPQLPRRTLTSDLSNLNAPQKNLFMTPQPQRRIINLNFPPSDVAHQEPFPRTFDFPTRASLRRKNSKEILYISKRPNRGIETDSDLEEESQNLGFNTFPDDVLLKIINHTNVADLQNGYKSCPSFRKLINEQVIKMLRKSDDLNPTMETYDLNFPSDVEMKNLPN